MAAKKKPKRVLLKISGEALMGSKNYGIDPAVTDFIAKEVKAAKRSNIEKRTSSVPERHA